MGNSYVEGFVLVMDTLCHGVIPAERDELDRVIMYATQADAEAEREDIRLTRVDVLTSEELEADSPGDDVWVERAQRLSDGTLILEDCGRIFTPARLREIIDAGQA